MVVVEEGTEVAVEVLGVEVGVGVEDSVVEEVDLEEGEEVIAVGEEEEEEEEVVEEVVSEVEEVLLLSPTDMKVYSLPEVKKMLW